MPVDLEVGGTRLLNFRTLRLMEKRQLSNLKTTKCFKSKKNFVRGNVSPLQAISNPYWYRLVFLDGKKHSSPTSSNLTKKEPAI